MRRILMKNISGYLFAVILLVTASKAFAQPIQFRGLSTIDGLPDLVISAIHKDSMGFVWLGTGISVERFDGAHIKHYSIEETEGKSRRVNAFAELPGNDIWMGNYMGLWRLDKTAGIFEPVDRETLNCPVYALLHDNNGTLYIGTEKGLYIRKGEQMDLLLPDNNILSESNAITDLTQGEEGTLWMATRNGLYTLQAVDGKPTITPRPLGAGLSPALYTITYMDSTVYLGTKTQGIIRYDTRTGQSDNYVEVGCNIITALSCDKNRKMLYVGTDGNGVHFISTQQGEITRSFRHEAGNNESIRSNSVYSLLVDKEHIIWIGYFQFGLDYSLYQKELFTTYAFPPLFDSKDITVRSIAINGQQKLIGSRDGIFYVDEQRGIYKSFLKPQLRSDMIFSTLFYQGEYYIGTYGGGMYILNPHTQTLRDFEPDKKFPFVKGNIFSLREDAGILWIGTSEGLFCYKDGKLLTHFTMANSKLPDNTVYSIFFDSTHKGWVSTDHGVCVWDPASKALRTDVFPEGFVNKEMIRSFYEDSSHNLYFILGKGRIVVTDLSMKKFNAFLPDSPLKEKKCMFMLEDDNKNIWIGTDSGLFRYDKNGSMESLSFVDGVPSPVFISCTPVKENGRLWFGNTKGLISIDQSKDPNGCRLPYRIKVTDILANGNSIYATAYDKASDRLEIGANISQKSFSFCLSDFSYTDPKSLNYEYKMEGLDSVWNELCGKSEITYYDLPSGNYDLKIRRMNDNESEMSLKIHVATYISGWTMAALAFTLLIVVVAYYEVKKRRRHSQSVAVATSTQEEDDMQEEDNPPTGNADNAAKYKSNKLSDEECAAWKEKLEELIRDQKPYKNPELKLGELADMLGISLHNLSYLFNSYLNCKYNDYINNCRINEFKQLVSQEESSKYTLETLSEQCGFNSKTSFFRNFKRVEGITPNEYVRRIEKAN